MSLSAKTNALPRDKHRMHQISKTTAEHNNEQESGMVQDYWTPKSNKPYYVYLDKQFYEYCEFLVRLKQMDL